MKEVTQCLQGFSLLQLISLNGITIKGHLIWKDTFLCQFFHKWTCTGQIFTHSWVHIWKKWRQETYLLKLPNLYARHSRSTFTCIQKHSRLRYPLWKFSSLSTKQKHIYEGRLKVILQLQVSSHYFEPTFIILVLICRTLPDHPK